MSDHSLSSWDEKHIRHARIWAITIIACAALLLASGLLGKSADREEILPETVTVFP